MSQENVEIVRRWNAAYGRRDTEALFALTASDFEWRSIFLQPQSPSSDGRKGLDAYSEAIDDAYERFLLRADEFIDAGAAVLVVTHVEWRGKESGAEGTMPLFVAAWLRAGEVFRIGVHEKPQAVGLSEQEAHADS